VDLSDLLGGPGPLPEHESSLVLERYAVRVADHRRAVDPTAAVAAARKLGFPVVVKRDGPAHKSATGGVLTDLGTAEAVEQAARKLGGAMLVARQVPPGPEAFCGMTRDPDYGPVLAVGWGGAGVEGREPALELAPIDRRRAAALVRDAGLPESAAELADILIALSRIAATHPEIEEVDINPVIITTDGAIAVDALVVVGGGARYEAILP
jgi:acetyltransferase